jgi:hypothetical protein
MRKLGKKRHKNGRLSDIIWNTKDGRSIPVNCMTERHIINTYRFLERTLDTIQENISAAYMYAPSGDMAEYYWNQDVDFLHENSAYVNQWLRIFDQEMSDRGIKLK